MNPDTSWRYADPQGQQRLVRLEELRAALASGLVAPNTPVWRAGWKEWQPAYAVAELTTSAIAAEQGVTPNIPPPPLAVVAAQTAYEDGEGRASLPSTPSNYPEPPPPPRYVPAPTRVAGGLHTPYETRAAVAPPSGQTRLPSSAMLRAAVRARSASSAGIAAPTAGAAATSAKKRASVAGLAAAPNANANVNVNVNDERPTAPTSDEGSASVAPPAPPTMVDPSVAPPPASDDPERSTAPDGPPTEASSGAETENAPEGRSAIVAPEPTRPSSDFVVPGSDEWEAVEAAKEPKETNAPRAAAPVDAPRVHPTARLLATTPVVGVESVDDAARASDAAPPVAKGGTLVLYAPPPAGETTSRGRAAPIVVPPPRPAGPPAPKAGVKPITGAYRAPPAPKSPSVRAPVAPPVKPPPPPARVAPTEAVELSDSLLVPDHSTSTIPPSALIDDVPEAAPPRGDRSDETRDAAVATDREADAASNDAASNGANDAGLDAAAEDAAVNDAAAMPLPRPPPVPRMPSVGGRTLTGLAPMAAPSPFPEISAGPIAAPSEDPPALASTQKPPPFESAPEMRRSQARLHDLRILRERPRWLVPAAAAAAILVVGGGIALSRGGKGKSDAARESSATSAAVAPAPAKPAPPPAVSCALAGGPHVLAPRAVVSAGIELAPFANAPEIGVGLAIGPNEGLAVRLDPGSLAVVATAKLGASDAVRRVVPWDDNGKLDVFGESERKGDRLQNRRFASTSPALDVGVVEGALAVAPHASDKTTKLWALEGDGAVEAARATPITISGKKGSEMGIAVAFRRAGAIYVGTAFGDPLAARGDLVRVAGLGAQVGSPAIAASGGNVVVAWADRGAPTEPWGLRLLRVAGEGAAGAHPEARTFVVPAGGLGEHAMSPSLAALDGGRFLLAWTEGPVSAHQVRAVTLDDAAQPVGAPLTVSDAGVNAGQAQALVGRDGRGLVGFLAAGDQGFEVVARPVTCRADLATTTTTTATVSAKTATATEAGR